MIHDWTIEEREYARQEQRRGRRHAYETVAPELTALVVVDLVPFFFDANPYCHGVVPHVNRIAEALRHAGGAVAWVLPGRQPPSAAYEEFYGLEVAETLRGSAGEGQLRQRLWPDLEVMPDDVVVEKTGPSAFFPGRSSLPGLLERRGIETVLVCGTVTNVCVESSVRDASNLGYRVVLVPDGCAAMRDRDHNATLHTVYRSFGDVRPTDEVIALLAGDPCR